MLDAIELCLDDLLDIMESKELQHQWEVVRIQQELCHVLELENVCGSTWLAE